MGARSSTDRGTRDAITTHRKIALPFTDAPPAEGSPLASIPGGASEHEGSGRPARRRRRRSELRDELPGLRRVPARRLTGILRLPAVRTVEDAIFRRVTRGAALVIRALVR